MAAKVEIKPLQLWERLKPGKAKSSSRVTVDAVLRDASGEVEEVTLEYFFATGAVATRRGTISAAGLRRRYKLVAEQETLA